VWLATLAGTVDARSGFVGRDTDRRESNPSDAIVVRGKTPWRQLMMKRRAWTATAIAGLVALAISIGWARAEHVRIEVTPPPPAPPSTTVIVPAPATPAVPALAPPQLLNADQIKAHQVRADTIYANRIEADEIRGQVHQTKDVKIGDTKGEIKAPEVAASIIYADEISANTVIAQHVYVRDLRRR
jgi:hypothetical protein